MKSALDWLLHKSSSIIGNQESSLTPPSTALQNDSETRNQNFDTDSKENSCYNGQQHRRSIKRERSPRFGERSEALQSASPWGRSLIPKSSKLIPDQNIRSHSNFNMNRKNCPKSWEEMRLSSEVTGPGFASSIIKEALSCPKFNDGTSKYPTGQERFIRTGVLPNVRLKGHSKPVVTARRAPSSPLFPLASSSSTFLPNNSTGFLASATTRMPDISSVASILESTPSTSAQESINDPTNVQAVVAALEQAQILRSGVKRSRFVEQEDSNKKQKYMKDKIVQEPIPIYSTPKSNHCYASALGSGGEKRALDLSPPSSTENTPTKTHISPENKRRCIPDPRVASYSSSKHINKEIFSPTSSGRETPFSMFDSQQDSDSESNKSMESKQSEQSFREQANDSMIGRMSSSNDHLERSGSNTPQSTKGSTLISNGSSSSSRTATPQSKPSHVFSLEAYKADKAKSQQRLNKMLGMLFNVSDEEAQASLQAQRKTSEEATKTPTLANAPSVSNAEKTSLDDASSNKELPASLTASIKPSISEPSIISEKANNKTIDKEIKKGNLSESTKVASIASSSLSPLTGSSSLTNLLSKGHKLAAGTTTMSKSPTLPKSESLLPKSLSFLNDSLTSSTSEAVQKSPSSRQPEIGKTSSPASTPSLFDIAKTSNNSSSGPSVPTSSPLQFSFGKTAENATPQAVAAVKPTVIINPSETSAKPPAYSFAASSLTSPSTTTANSSKGFSFGASSLASDNSQISNVVPVSLSATSGVTENATVASNSDSKFSFGAPASSTEAATAGGFTFNASTPSKAPIFSASSGGFSIEPKTTSNSSTGFSFSTTAPVSTISSQPKDSTTTKDGGNLFSFGNLNKPASTTDFSFGSQKPSTTVYSSTSADQSGTEKGVSKSLFSSNVNEDAAAAFGNALATPFGSQSTATSSISFGNTSTATTTVQSSTLGAISSTAQLTTPSFGSVTNSSLNFSVGKSNVVESTSSFGSSFGATKTSAESIFSFGGSTTGSQNAASPPATFGAVSNSTFGGSTTVSTLSNSNKVPVTSPFGNSASSNTGIFGGSTAAAPTFGGSTDAVPTFGVSNTAAAPTFGGSNTAAPTFVGSNTAAAPTFGGSTASAPTFGGSNTAAAPTFGGSTAVPTFGGSTATVPIFGGSTASAPTFGSATKPGASFGSSINAVPTFGSSTNAAPTFGSTNNVPTFGSSTNAAPTFGSSTNAAPTFGSSTNTPPTFGSSTNATPTFGSSTNTAPSFGSSTNIAPTFGSSTNAPLSYGSSTNVAPTFGSSSNAANLFGSAPNATPSFGSETKSSTPSFGGASAFGNTGTTAFGVTNPTSPPTFGSSNTNATSNFGTSTPAFGGTSNKPLTFGSPAAPTFGTAPAPSFGQTAPSVSSSPFTFGQNASSQPATQGAGIFTFGSSGAPPNFSAGVAPTADGSSSTAIRRTKVRPHRRK